MVATLKPRRRAKTQPNAYEPFTLPARQLLALVADAALFASKEPSRPILTLVRLDLAGHRLTATATDSYTLIETRVDLDQEVTPVGGEWTRYLGADDRAVLTAMLKTSANRALGVHVAASPDDPGLTFTLGSQAVTVGTVIEDGTWPDIDKVWKSASGTHSEAVGLNPQLLLRFNRLSGARTGRKNGHPGVRFEPHGTSRPVTWSIGPNTRGLIMPCWIQEAS